MHAKNGSNVRKLVISQGFPVKLIHFLGTLFTLLISLINAFNSKIVLNDRPALTLQLTTILSKNITTLNKTHANSQVDQ